MVIPKPEHILPYNGSGIAYLKFDDNSCSFNKRINILGKLLKPRLGKTIICNTCVQTVYDLTK